MLKALKLTRMRAGGNPERQGVLDFRLRGSDESTIIIMIEFFFKLFLRFSYGLFPDHIQFILNP